MSAESVLVVDDEEVMRDVLQTLLSEAGLPRDAGRGRRRRGSPTPARQSFDAAIVDVMLPEMGGLEVLEELKKTDPELVVLMITAFASVETAIQAMKKGAFDYVTKPFKHEEVLHILRNGLRAAPTAGREPRAAHGPPRPGRASRRSWARARACSRSST